MHYRKDWLSQFSLLESEHEVTYVYVAHSSERLSLAEGHRQYAVDAFANARELLDRLAPQVVLFYGLEDGLYCTTIGVVAKSRAIPCLVVDHGLQLLGDSTLENAVTVPRKTHVVRFALSSYNWRYPLLSLLHFLMHSLKMVGLRRFARKSAFFRSIRLPDAYLCYSRSNSVWMKKMVGAVEEQFRYIGIPYFDEFFQRLPDLTRPARPYLLFVDQPLEGLADCLGIEFTERDREALLEKFLLASERLGLELVIRPHPAQSARPLVSHPGVRYEVVDMPQFRDSVEHAEIVVGFFSVMLVAILAVKPMILLEAPFNREFVAAMVSRGLAVSLPLKNFSEAHIEVVAPPPAGARDWLIDEYLTTIRGDARWRLCSETERIANAGSDSR